MGIRKQRLSAGAESPRRWGLKYGASSNTAKTAARWLTQTPRAFPLGVSRFGPVVAEFSRFAPLGHALSGFARDRQFRAKVGEIGASVRELSGSLDWPLFWLTRLRENRGKRRDLADAARRNLARSPAWQRESTAKQSGVQRQTEWGRQGTARIFVSGYSELGIRIATNSSEIQTAILGSVPV